MTRLALLCLMVGLLALLPDQAWACCSAGCASSDCSQAERDIEKEHKDRRDELEALTQESIESLESWMNNELMTGQGLNPGGGDGEGPMGVVEALKRWAQQDAGTQTQATAIQANAADALLGEKEKFKTLQAFMEAREHHAPGPMLGETVTMLRPGVAAREYGAAQGVEVFGAALALNQRCSAERDGCKQALYNTWIQKWCDPARVPVCENKNPATAGALARYTAGDTSVVRHMSADDAKELATVATFMTMGTQRAISGAQAATPAGRRAQQEVARTMAARAMGARSFTRGVVGNSIPPPPNMVPPELGAGAYARRMLVDAGLSEAEAAREIPGELTAQETLMFLSSYLSDPNTLARLQGAGAAQAERARAGVEVADLTMRAGTVETQGSINGLLAMIVARQTVEQTERLQGELNQRR